MLGRKVRTQTESSRDKARYFTFPSGQQQEHAHPTVKPLPLMMKIVRNVNAETILDPFMGTGTTGEACIKQGKRFVGIEVIPKYFDMACRRLEAANRQPDMFIKAAEHAGAA